MIYPVGTRKPSFQIRNIKIRIYDVGAAKRAELDMITRCNFHFQVVAFLSNDKRMAEKIDVSFFDCGIIRFGRRGCECQERPRKQRNRCKC